MVFRSTEGAVVVNGAGINETFSTFEALITNTLSIDDSQLALSNVKLYPNPVNNILNIELSNAIAIESVTILDLNGRTVLTSKVSSINTSQLQSGFYVARVDTEVGSITRKFIKK